MARKRRRDQPYHRAGARRRPVTRRRRTSTASTLGTAAGVALAGVLAALGGGLPWWAWALLIVVGLVVGLAWAARRGRPAAAGDAARAGENPPLR